MLDEPPVARTGPRRRWTLPVLGLAVALLFGYVGTHRYPVPAAETAGEAAAPTPLPTFGDGLPRVTGDRAAGPAGLRLLVSGTHPSVLDARSGQSARVPGLPLGRDEMARLQPVPGGLVATVTGWATVRTRTLLLPAGGLPLPLGDDVRVIPAGRGGELIVSSYGPGGTDLRVTDRSGRVRSRWARPGLLTPLRDTPLGLVVAHAATAGSSGADLLLVEPGSGALRRRLATGRFVLAVGPSSVAHLPASCGRDCPLTVTELGSGRSRDYRTPDAGSPSRGQFSPDGRWLALAVPGQYLNGRLTIRPGFAAVLDLATGDVRQVPGVETPVERVSDLSWWGEVLVLAVWWEDRAQVGVWWPDRPGELRVLVAEPPGDYRTSTVTVLPP